MAAGARYTLRTVAEESVGRRQRARASEATGCDAVQSPPQDSIVHQDVERDQRCERSALVVEAMAVPPSTTFDERRQSAASHGGSLFARRIRNAVHPAGRTGFCPAETVPWIHEGRQRLTTRERVG